MNEAAAVLSGRGEEVDLICRPQPVGGRGENAVVAFANIFDNYVPIAIHGEGIVARFAPDGVLACPTVEHVIAAKAVKDIVTALAKNGVLALISDDRLTKFIARKSIGAVPCCTAAVKSSISFSGRSQ